MTTKCVWLVMYTCVKYSPMLNIYTYHEHELWYLHLTSITYFSYTFCSHKTLQILYRLSGRYEMRVGVRFNLKIYFYLLANVRFYGLKSTF